MLQNVKISMQWDGHPRMYNADIRASRVWEKLLVTWRVESEPARHFGSFLSSEKAFGIGAFYWELETGEIRWTPGMFRLTCLDPDKGIPPVDKIVTLIHPNDQAELVKNAMENLRDGQELRVELRGHGSLAGRVFELVADAELAPGGEVRVVRGACRDVTAERRDGDRHRRDQISTAALRAERDALRSHFSDLSAPSTSNTVLDIEITGHVVNATATAARSWYDVVDLPEDVVALIVGEVSGDDPTAAMLRLRLAATAFVAAGMNPDEALSAVNTAFAATVPGRTATMTLAYVNLEADSLTWSAAGQAIPVLSRGDDRDGHLISGSLGLPIGADSPMAFPLNRTGFNPGDQVLLYTEGLMVTPGSTTPRQFEALRKAAAAASAELAFGKISDSDPRVTDTEAGLLLLRRPA